MSGQEKLVLGVDFGSDSARAVLAGTETGIILGTGVCVYPRWAAGKYQHPEQAIFRQHPRDYLEALEKCIREALGCLPEEDKKRVIGIGVDTTGSTLAPVDKNGTPLALLDAFSENEKAMFCLWKDHSAWKEAQELTRIFSGSGHPDYGKYMGKYSAEWFWAKILHGIREDEDIRDAAYTWVEHCDWMVGCLCGNTLPETMYHSACAAGYKALWHSEWGGLPDRDTLSQADPYLGLVRDRYGKAPEDSFHRAGTLSEEWAEKLGLPGMVTVSGSSFDAHAGAVGAGIKPGTMVCTLGTSAVSMLVAAQEVVEKTDITRFGGSAENAILPSLTGIETGQSAFGDIFAWFKRLLLWPVQDLLNDMGNEHNISFAEKIEEEMLCRLEAGAKKETDIDVLPVALDWFNGRRYPDNDDFQRAAVTGLSLGTTAPQFYYSLVFAACAGLARICFGFEEAGLEIKSVRAVGGISKKSGLLMQMLADLLDKKISILDSDQTCALGAAIYAAVGSGYYKNPSEAVAHMAAREIKCYAPDSEMHAKYMKMYEKYLALAERES